MSTWFAKGHLRNWLNLRGQLASTAQWDLFHSEIYGFHESRSLRLLKNEKRGSRRRSENPSNCARLGLIATVGSNSPFSRIRTVAGAPPNCSGQGSLAHANQHFASDCKHVAAEFCLGPLAATKNILNSNVVRRSSNSPASHLP